MASKGKKTPVHAENSSDSEFIRRFKTNPFIFVGTIVILIIVIIAFVLVPAIVPRSGQTVDLTFGLYDKVPISYVPGNYFAQYYGMLADYQRRSGDPNYNQYGDFQLWQEAYQAAALRTAILLEMKKSGYSVPPKTVDREVARQYQQNGRFSAALYESEDRNSRLTRWRRTEEELTVGQFYSDIGVLLKPSRAAVFISEMASPRRSFDMVSFPVSDYPQTEVAAYGGEHADLFRQTHLSKITISSSEREARQILSSIKDGVTTFEDAARTHSKDAYAERGGDMGSKAAHELLIDIPEEAEREMIIALGRGEYSDVIKIDTQWAFFRAEDEVKPADISDPAVLERIRAYIQNFERGRMENWAVAQAEDFIGLVNKDGFDKALDQKGITKYSFGPIPINYGDVNLFDTLSSSTSIPELSGSSTDENFWKIAFSTRINSASRPLVQGGNVLVLFPTSEVEAEESVIDSIQSAYSYWFNSTFEQSLRPYFLYSDKMEDRFMETFFRYLMPSGF
jgi:hypothetical protein